MKKSQKIVITALLCVLVCAIILLIGCNKKENEPKDTEVITTDPSNSETNAPETNIPETNSPETEAHVHSFGDWSIKEEATCTSEGTEERICTCGTKESNTIPVKEHSWDEGKISEDTDKKTFTCLECNATKEEDIVHIFTVTEEEWSNALNLLLSPNYVHTITSSANGMNMVSIIEKNENIIRTNSTQGEYSMIQYWVVENDQYRLHEKQDPNITSYYSNLQFEYDKIFLYSNFQYNEETQSYISEKIIAEGNFGLSLPPSSDIYSDLSFQFKDGKLVSLSYTLSINMGQLIMVNTEAITYGNAPELSLPDLE